MHGLVLSVQILGFIMIFRSLSHTHKHSGCAATVAALTFGLVNFKRGNTAKSQLAMRMRVVAQTGTVVALALGVLWNTSRDKTSPKRTS